MPAKTKLIPKGQYSLGTILSKSWAAYRENFTKILYITLLVYIPVNILIYFLPVPENLESFGDLINWMSLLEFFIGIISTLAISLLIKHWVDKKELEWFDALRNILPVWSSAIWVQLISGILIGLATLLLILPGIYLMISYLFVIHALLFQKKTGMDALMYSYNLVKGRWWRTFGIALVIGLLTFIASWIPDLIYLIAPAHFITDLATMTASDLIYAYSIVAFVIMYLNYDNHRVHLPAQTKSKK